MWVWLSRVSSRYHPGGAHLFDVYWPLCSVVGDYRGGYFL